METQNGLIKIPFKKIWNHCLTGEWRVQPPTGHEIFKAVEQNFCKLISNASPAVIEVSSIFADVYDSLLFSERMPTPEHKALL